MLDGFEHPSLFAIEQGATQERKRLKERWDSLHRSYLRRAAGQPPSRRTGRTRSEIYSTALRDCLAHHEAVPVTAAVDRALDEIDPEPDSFLEAALRETLTGAEW